MNKLKLIFLLVFICFQTTNAQNEYPVLTEIVTDNAGVFSDSQTLQLKEKLTNFETETTHQIVVLTIDYLGNDTIENYAEKTFNRDGNKFGQAEKDNGILILFSNLDREVRIEVGDGLTPIITDLFASRIIRNIMIPEFKNEDYFEGISKGTSEIIKIINDPIYAQEFADKIEKEGEVGIVTKFFSALFLTPVFFLLGFFGYNRLIKKNKAGFFDLKVFYINHKTNFLIFFGIGICVVMYFNAFSWYVFLALFIIAFFSVFVVIGFWVILKMAYERAVAIFEALFSGKLGIVIFPFYVPITIILVVAGTIFTLMPLGMGIAVFLSVFFQEFLQNLSFDVDPLYILFGVIAAIILFFISTAIIAVVNISKNKKESFGFSFFTLDKSLRSSVRFGGSSSGSSRSYSSSGYSSSSSSSSFSGGGGSSSGGGASGSW